MALTPTGYRVNVVVVEPTIFYPMVGVTRRQLRKLVKRDPDAIRDRMEQYAFNEMMCRWIAQTGHNLSIGFEMWYFDDRLMDPMAARIETVCGQYIIRHEFYKSEWEAQMALNADPSVAAVYDADRDRVEEYWRFRGYSVDLGGTP
jgi:hypothetical protein